MQSIVYGYARCSTDETKQDISRQVKELKQLGATAKTIYLEYESGAKADRVELHKMFDAAKNDRQKNLGVTVVVTEVSRITRSTKQLCDIIQLIEENRLKLEIKGSITIDCSSGEVDAMSKAFLRMAGVFAELERDMISARVKSGMRNAREKGVIIGRPTTTIDNLPTNFLRHYQKFESKQINLSEFARLCGVCRQSIYKYIAIYKSNVKTV